MINFEFSVEMSVFGYPELKKLVFRKRLYIPMSVGGGYIHSTYFTKFTWKRNLGQNMIIEKIR